MGKMPACDMCGSENRLFKAEIEGTLLNVCKYCAKYGKVLAPVRKPKPIAKKDLRIENVPEKEVIQLIVPEYSQLVKNARERMGLKHEDFGKRINEKASLIHNIETGKVEPSITLAKKLERFLRIKLIADYEEEHGELQKIDSESFTIGDMIKVRK